MAKIDLVKTANNKRQRLGAITLIPEEVKYTRAVYVWTLPIGS